jgi:hypothetical protein
LAFSALFRIFDALIEEKTIFLWVFPFFCVYLQPKCVNGGTTDIGTSPVNSEEVNSEKWYDLNGRQLQEKPTQKGVYLNGGRKVVVVH